MAIPPVAVSWPWELGVRDKEFGVAPAEAARFEVLADGEGPWEMPMSASAVDRPMTWEGPGLDMGWLTLVDR